MSSLKYNIADKIEMLKDEIGYHPASEEYVRIQFYNFEKEAGWGIAYEGEIVLTAYKGVFEIKVGDKPFLMSTMDQIVINKNEELRIICQESGTLQFIWTPPFMLQRLLGDGDGR